MFSKDNAPNCSISPSFSFNITVLVKVYLLFTISSLSTAPSFNVSFNGLLLTIKIELKLKFVYVPLSTPSN